MVQKEVFHLTYKLIFEWASFNVAYLVFGLPLLNSNISSVVEFQSKLFGQESTCHQGKILKKIL